MFAETKFFHKAGEGSGGGSDPHNLGYYADLTALQTAHPTGADGDFAILGSTDTIWVWDSGTSAWKDTDTKGQVTSVNGQTGAVTVDALPSQTGQSGKFLTTNGTDASWATINALQNAATGTDSLTLLGTPSTGTQTINIGASNDSGGSQASVVIGDNAKIQNSGSASTVIGAYAQSRAWFGTAIGEAALATQQYATAIGAVAQATGTRSIQIGQGTNSTANTFSVGLSDSNNYRLLNSDGTIPADRLPNAINKYSTMPTAASTNEGWIVQFTGTTDSTYTHGYIYECKAQGTDPETYAWEAVEVQASGGGGLPSQTGNSGKFLTTDGTDPSWATINALQNTATGTNSLTVGGNAAYNQRAVNVGSLSTATEDSVAIGYHAYTWASYNTAIGADATASSYSTRSIRGDTAIGANSEATNGYGLALGFAAKVNAFGAVQIGPATNSTVATVCIALKPDANTTAINYRLLNSDGTIPKERLTNVVTTPSTAPVLAVADWSSNTQTITVTGVTATNTVFVAPAPASAADYAAAGILCTAQAANSLTFTCTTVPTNAITLSVVILG